MMIRWSNHIVNIPIIYKYYPLRDNYNNIEILIQ